MSRQAELILDLKNSVGTISSLIYGHFTEHIGGVFYDGLWVGENSGVENIRGFRKALVDSFKKINPRWCVGRADIVEIPAAGIVAITIG